MSIKKLSLALGLAVLLPMSATAIVFPVAPTGGGTDTVNRGYAALKWTFGKTMTPEFVLGFRHAQVDANGDTDGGDISMSFNLVGGVTPGKLRAKYFNGQEKVQSEVGAGYDFSNGLFAGISLQGPYSNIGVDYLFKASSPFEPFFMLNTLKTNDKPAATTCPANYVYTAGQCSFQPN
ncbi:MAG: hypothetical protein MUR51_02215 [Pseudomonadota bacterium]|nr:hypothetical protein [Pseudomonadota bacterium]